MLVPRPLFEQLRSFLPVCMAGFVTATSLLICALSPLSTYAQEQVTITHYGYPSTFNGRPTGCRPYNLYYNTDPTILAVGYSRAGSIPCGQEVEITGPAGQIVVTRQDTCPGCHHNMFDLSDAASLLVCGLNRSGQLYTCQATMRIIE